jgi:hypothetical protein
MAGSKLPNGKAQATFGALAFSVLDCPPPAYTKGEAPNTTTNDNTIFESFGKSEYITIENMTLECAFKADDYKVMPTTMNTIAALTITDIEDTTYVYDEVEIMKYTAGAFTKDGFPTASIEFKIFTGVDGATAPTVTIGT